MTYANQQVYKGEWVNNKREGKGSLLPSNSDSSYFDGIWENGEFKTGKLRYVHANRNTYEGEFKDGKMHGKGKSYYLMTADGKPDNTSYEGQCVNDKRQGQGTLKMKNGSIYTGNWMNDK